MEQRNTALAEGNTKAEKWRTDGRTQEYQQSQYGRGIDADIKAEFENGHAVLHGPDQVVGGNPLHFDGVGDARVNSSLESQWKDRRVEDLDDFLDSIVGEFGSDLAQRIRPRFDFGVVVA